MFKFSAKKKAYLWVLTSQAFWPSYSWTDWKPLASLHTYLTTGEEMADQFHYTMNNLHPKLKFEIEKSEITPDGLSLSLLDFKVTISKDGKSSFEFYRKTAKKPLFVHHQSELNRKSRRSTSFVTSGNVTKINALQKRQPQSIKTCLTMSSVLTGILKVL